jgi:hypothetical protein
MGVGNTLQKSVHVALLVDPRKMPQGLEDAVVDII